MRILIIEDQFLIAMAMEDAILGLGHEVAGIFSSAADIYRYGLNADLALVDVNLADGPSGPEIGRYLAAQGCSVIFMTANPERVAGGVAGTMGFISKPVQDLDIVGAIQFAHSCRAGDPASPPASLKLFH